MASRGAWEALAAEMDVLARDFAHDVAASLLDGSAAWELQGRSGASSLLRGALLAEGGAPLRSDGVCAAVHRALGDALLGSVAEAPFGEEEAAPPVHVEVRGTAGRTVRGGVLTVGSAPECTVQVCGDPTLLPFQHVAFSLPIGIIVVNVGSWCIGPRVAACGPGKFAPAAGLEAQLVGPEDKLLLQLGPRAAVSLQQRRAAAGAEPRPRSSAEEAHEAWKAARPRSESTFEGLSRESCASGSTCSAPAGRSARSRTPPQGARGAAAAVVSREAAAPQGNWSGWAA